MSSLILHGRRSIIELQKWRHLSVSMKLLPNVSSSSSNSFSSASAAADVTPRDGLKGQRFTVSYLVDSLGLTRKLAETISRKVRFEEKGNPDSVLSLLRSHGFIDSQISSIITIYPGLLLLDSEKSLGPKLQSLQSRGASSSEITEIVSTIPKILGKGGGKTINRYYDLVKGILRDDEVLCQSLPEGNRQENKIRNVMVLRELGVPHKSLFSLLISNFSTLCGKERFEESLKKVVEMGFDPTSSRFVKALNYLYALSDKTIEETVNIYKSLGFAEGDVWEMFKKYPALLTYSEKKILSSIETFLVLGFSRDEFVMMVKCFPQCIGLSAESVKKADYLVKKMNWPLKGVVSNPVVLGYSMEKRIVPRCNVIKALTSKGFLGSELPTISYVLVCTDQTFLKRYVRKYDVDKELVAELMVIFTGKKIKTDKSF